MKARQITHPCTELPVVLVDDLSEYELLEVDISLGDSDDVYVTIQADPPGLQLDASQLTESQLDLQEDEM